MSKTEDYSKKVQFKKQERPTESVEVGDEDTTFEVPATPASVPVPPPTLAADQPPAQRKIVNLSTQGIPISVQTKRGIQDFVLKPRSSFTCTPAPGGLGPDVAAKLAAGLIAVQNA